MKKIVKKNFEKNKGTLKKSKADMVEINVTPWNRTGKIVQVHKRPPTLLHALSRPAEILPFQNVFK